MFAGITQKVWFDLFLFIYYLEFPGDKFQVFRFKQILFNCVSR